LVDLAAAEDENNSGDGKEKKEERWAKPQRAQKEKDGDRK
jgi:hypothetical protein